MSTLANAMKKLKFDKRMVDYNISRGEVTKEEWEKFLNSLPDSGSNAGPVEIENSSADHDTH